MSGVPPAPAGAGAADPFASAPPSYQGEPSIDAQGSPQFENAVRLVKDNRFTEAKGILTSETNRNPGNASAWRWLADCHYNLLELDDAINCYQRALERDPNDFYALRGQGFSYLHRGHEYWRQMQEQVANDQKDSAAATFAQAHDNYKKSLELLGLCLRRAPNDGEAVYGEAMAAEGASRKLYSNAISYLKLGPEQRERAELFAENCMTVINKGVERSRERARQNPGDAGPRALLGGLYMRKAILYHQLDRNDAALIELRNARDVQRSILDEIDKNNATAQKNLRECEA
jgi:tetratricopeptide (TPR) repeat protein